MLLGVCWLWAGGYRVVLVVGCWLLAVCKSDKQQLEVHVQRTGRTMIPRRQLRTFCIWMIHGIVAWERKWRRARRYGFPPPPPPAATCMVVKTCVQTQLPDAKHWKLCLYKHAYKRRSRKRSTESCMRTCTNTRTNTAPFLRSAEMVTYKHSPKRDKGPNRPQDVPQEAPGGAQRGSRNPI